MFSAKGTMLCGVLAPLLFIAVDTVSAATYSVPGDFIAIQTALSDSGVVDGDSIVVEPGLYLENIHFEGKAVTLTSTDPNDPGVVAATIIDGSLPADPNVGSVISFVNDEGPGSVITGFTIQNGTGQSDPTIGSNPDFIRSNTFNGPNGDGGGIFCRASSPTITKNTFKNNQSQYGGGAIFCHNAASPIISQNTFINNITVFYGGAIFCRVDCLAEIKNNTFIENRCNSLGGAIYFATRSHVIVSGNWFESNHSLKLQGGAIYYFVSSDPTIANNIFWKNTARISASAIMVDNPSGEIINNSFIENKVLVSSSFNATLGIYANCLLANNIIMNSTGGGLYTSSGVVPVIQNNCFWNNSAGNYQGHVADQTGLNGNIAVDPQMGANLPCPFTAFELEPNSPCRDTGMILAQQLADDFDGSPRVVNGSVDMGAQEYNAIAVPQDYTAIQAAMDAATEDDTVLVSPGFYQENLNFNGKNLILRSLNPLDPDCVAQTILDGGQNGSCITLDSGETKNSVIAGLTIQNGFAEGNIAVKTDPIYGGGIYVDNPDNVYPAAGATILYNYIHHNTSRSYGGGIDARFYVDVYIAHNRIEYNATLERLGGGIHVAGDTICKMYDNVIGHNSSDSFLGQGGGIYVLDTSYVEIVGNEICHNIAGEGGGIYLLDSDGIIERNYIYDNIAFQNGGGGICVSQFAGGSLLALAIRNNLIMGNAATSMQSAFNGEGGGLLLFSIGSSEVVNNTIVGNYAPEGKGAGLTSAIKATPLIQNNIIAYNRGGAGLNTYPADPNAATVSTPTVLANNVWNNGAAGEDNFHGSLSDLTGVDGNLSADPVFVAAGFYSDNDTPENPNDDFWQPGDYRIGWFSPCRDAGLTDAAVPVDIRRISRPQFNGFDIGAFETEIYDLTANGTVGSGDLALLISGWLAQGPDPALDLNGDGVVDLAEFALLSGNWLEQNPLWTAGW